MSLRAAVKPGFEPAMHQVEAGSTLPQLHTVDHIHSGSFPVPFFKHACHLTSFPPHTYSSLPSPFHTHCEQGYSCLTSDATTLLLLGKSGRNSTSYTYTSLPPRQARKSHRPFNSGINDQQEHTASKTTVYGPTRVYTDRGWGRGARARCQGKEK